jgi:hypothetical protein
LVDEAVAQWTAIAGPDAPELARLGDLHHALADLPGGTVGTTVGTTIYIDPDAGTDALTVGRHAPARAFSTR